MEVPMCLFRPRTRIVTTLAAVSVAVVVPGAHATCGSAYCFLDTATGQGLEPKGTLTVDLSFQYVDQSRKRAGRDATGEVLTPKVSFEDGVLEPDHHREIRTSNSLVQLVASYGINDRLSLYLHLPLVNQRDHEHFDEVGTPDEFFTGQDGTSGFGDVRLGARYGLLLGGRDRLVGDLAVKLPTGSYTLRDSEGGINEPTIQPGTGSTDFLGGLRWSHQIAMHRLETFTAVSYRFNTENSLDYRFGDEAMLNAGFQHSLSPDWTWSLQLNARHTARDRFLEMHVPSTGATLVNGTPGLRYVAASGTQIYLFLQSPVYQDVNEAQVTPRFGIVVGVTKAF
jgi:hypothetical protein